MVFLYEINAALGAIKDFLQKQNPVYNILDVKDVNSRKGSTKPT